MTPTPFSELHPVRVGLRKYLALFVAIAFSSNTQASESQRPDKVRQAVLGQLGARSSFVVSDSGYEGESLVAETVAWIDNDRVLFTGYGPLAGPRPADRYDHKALYAWDTRTGKITKYASLSRGSGFCFASGVVRYWFERQGSLVERFGRLGEEREHVYSPEERKVRSSWWLNKFTCKWYMPEELPQGEGVFFRPLRDKDGYLGSSVDIRKSLTIYLPSEGGQYVTLPIPERTAAMGYSAFFGVYVLKETPALLARGEDMAIRFWLFTPQQGRVESLVIPAGPWMNGTLTYVMPTKQGVFFASTAIGEKEGDGNYSPGAGGGYLFQKNKVHRVTSGYPYSAEVSPDGCKVVLNMVSRRARGLLPTIRMTNVCGKEQ